MIKGKLQALSIQTYGIFVKKKLLASFEVKNLKIRKKLDVLQGTIVSIEDIKKLIKQD